MIFERKDGVLERYVEEDADLKIILPEGIIVIGKEAFSTTRILAEIIVPEGVERIDDYAFANCRRLQKVSLPSTVTSIGKAVFSACKMPVAITVDDRNERYFAVNDCIIERATRKLVCGTQSSVIPADGRVEVIGEKAFYRCFGLTGIDIPSSVKRIEYGAFCECDDMREAVLRKGLESVGEYAFYGCKKLAQVSLPEGLTSIGNGAFATCESIEKLILPQGLSCVGKSAFYGCKGLQKVTFSDGLKRIESSAFFRCAALREITLPEGLVEIGRYAFFDCQELQKIEFPESLEQIGAAAFESCEKVRSTTFPDGIKTDFFAAVKNGILRYFGSELFYLSPLAERYSEYPFRRYRGCEAVVVYPAYPFEKISEEFKEAFLQGFLEESERYSRENQQVYWRFLMEKPYRIRKFLFERDRADLLQRLTDCLPMRLEDYYTLLEAAQEQNARSCIAVLLVWKHEHVTSQDEEAYQERQWEDDRYDEEKMKKLWRYQITDGAVTITGCGKNFSSDASGTVCIPPRIGKNFVTAVGDFAFSERVDWKHVLLPESLRRIGRRAFAGCRKMRDVYIPAGVQAIETDAFFGCPSLVVRTPSDSYAYTFSVAKAIPVETTE